MNPCCCYFIVLVCVLCSCFLVSFYHFCCLFVLDGEGEGGGVILRIPYLDVLVWHYRLTDERMLFII